jgi:ATP-dependent RNA helicase DeaD
VRPLFFCANCTSRRFESTSFPFGMGEKMGKIKFSDFHLPNEVMSAIERLGFKAPTEIQAQAIPLIFNGDDLLATAQTGTGKTAAFGIPLLSRFLSYPTGELRERALIVAPTRELAEQIHTSITELCFFAPHLRSTLVIGGVSPQRQIRELADEPSFVVGTPGRLLDHADASKFNLNGFSCFVIDEADRLLDMGFEPQIKALVGRLHRQPRSHTATHRQDRVQTLMFSATLPPSVSELAQRYLYRPVRVSIGAANKPVECIKQDVLILSDDEKDQRLMDEIDKIAGSIIVFTRTKLRADHVAQQLSEIGHQAEPLHGDLTQAKRRRVTERFRSEKTRILVATDVAARGLDIPHVRHVINYDLPTQPEDYVHRIGRTGRAGADGHSIAFVTPAETKRWSDILSLTRGRVTKGKETSSSKNARPEKGKRSYPNTPNRNRNGNSNGNPKGGIRRKV